ncbi:glycosyltransferase [Mumia zhuanghuii]|uniref:glycosyltransferase n=1 Tax=Mumia zhuanghuii TaxID=2585211 RepID=UPI0036342A15
MRRAIQSLRRRLSARERSVLMESGLFDRDWYEAEAGRTFADLADAVDHYVREGAGAQLSPHPFFDPGVVRETAPGSTPFETLLTRKRFRGRAPHPAIDVDAYLATHPRAATHPYGVFGHLAGSVSDETLLPIVTAEGVRAVRWGAVRSRWREHATTWTATERLRRPGFVEELPAGHELPAYPPVEATAQTLVSIIIPTWNRATSLRRALASVQAQTWRHWEALVVDDGSVDNTVALVTHLAQQDPRIRLLQRPHEGVCAARNAGLDAAVGGFVAFLDSDNEWQPDYLDAMIRAMQAERLDVAYGTLMAQTPDGPRYRATPVTRDVLMVANHVDMNVLVVRGSLLAEVGGFDESLRRTVDYDLVLRLAEHTDLVHLPIIGVHYDDRRESADRISVREPAAWIDRVRLKHAVDWAALRETERDPGLVSVVLPVRGGAREVREKLSALAHGLVGRRWEIVVVDSAEERSVASTALGAFVDDNRIRYVRWPMRVSFAYAADLGFARTSGATVVFVDFDTLATSDAVQALLDYAAEASNPFVVQPVTLDRESVVVTAGGVLGPRHRLPAAFLGDFLAEDVDRLGSAPYAPPLADGRTFVIPGDAFAALGGLDPLLDDELELADLALRLVGTVPSARVDLLPKARVLRRAGETTSPRSVTSRAVFAERHAATLRETPPEVWKPWDARVAGWERLDGRAHALRPLLVREPGEGRRWVLLAGGREATGWVRIWAHALAAALEDLGQDAVVRRGMRATRRLSSLDDVVVALHGSCPLESSDPETVQVAWLVDDPAPATRWSRRADIILAAAPGRDEASVIEGPMTASAEGGWVGATVATLPDVAVGADAAGEVLLIGAAAEAGDVVRALRESGVEPHAVGQEWEPLLDGAWTSWPEDADTWVRLLAGARRVVVLVPAVVATEGVLPPPLLDALLVRGEVLSNARVGERLAGGVTTFVDGDDLVRKLQDAPRALDRPARVQLFDRVAPGTVARRLVARVESTFEPAS